MFSRRPILVARESQGTQARPSLFFRLVPLAVGTTLAALSLLNTIQPLNQAAAGEPNKSFIDVTEAMGLKGMSGGVAAWGDCDNDGWVDLCVGGEIWRNEKGKRFTRLGQVAGAAIWGDFDNDGYLDLFSWEAGGKLYHNLKGKEFKEVKFPPLPMSVSLGAAWGDWDNDGHLDLITGGKLFRNPAGPHHWLKVRLEGGGKVNRAAIGAQARVRLGDHTLTRQVEGATGQGNQNDLTLHFGLGDRKDPVRLEIRWPDGTRQELDTPVDRTISVKPEKPGSSTRTKRRVLYNFDGDSCGMTLSVLACDYETR